MMIDFISAELPIEPDFIRGRLEFAGRINPKTGEVIPERNGAYKETAKLGELVITIVTFRNNAKPRVNVSGSLHKHCNGNNYSDFHFADLCRTIWGLSETLGVSPDNFILHQIEFGLNVCPVLPSALYLSNLLSHKGNEYELRQYHGAGHLKRFNRDRYDLKMYDKGLQYGLFGNILRVELKVNKMAFFTGKTFTGIKVETLSDLLNPALYPKFRDAILGIVSELIFADDRIQFKDIRNPKHRAVYKEGANPRYWTKLRQEGCRKTFNRRKAKYNEIRVMYAPNDIENDLTHLLSSKFETLFQNVPFSPLAQNTEMSRFHTQIVNEIETTARQCLTCGRDITNQRNGSLYCSETLHGREVKKCRNKVSNLKVHETRFYPGETLFNIDDFLSPEYRRLKTIAIKTLN